MLRILWFCCQPGRKKKTTTKNCRLNPVQKEKNRKKREKENVHEATGRRREAR